jgi:hypothetical protein
MMQLISVLVDYVKMQKQLYKILYFLTRSSLGLCPFQMEEYRLQMLKKKDVGINIWTERTASEKKWNKSCIMRSSTTSITSPKIICVIKSRRSV